MAQRLLTDCNICLHESRDSPHDASRVQRQGERNDFAKFFSDPSATISDRNFISKSSTHCCAKYDVLSLNKRGKFEEGALTKQKST